jgi:hypothetical protein
MGLRCPECGDGDIVYNGNYFCSRWGDGCDWALSHGEDGEPVGGRDRKAWQEIQRTAWFRAAMRHNRDAIRRAKARKAKKAEMDTHADTSIKFPVPQRLTLNLDSADGTPLATLFENGEGVLDVEWLTDPPRGTEAAQQFLEGVRQLKGNLTQAKLVTTMGSVRGEAPKRKVRDNPMSDTKVLQLGTAVEYRDSDGRRKAAFVVATPETMPEWDEKSGIRGPIDGTVHLSVHSFTGTVYVKHNVAPGDGPETLTVL